MKAKDSIHPIRALVVFALVVFVGGALIAPWLYELTQRIFPGSNLAERPFHRYVNRALIGLALISVWPLLRGLGATSLRDFGIVKPAGQWKLLFGGFALSFGSLAIAAFISVAGGASRFNSALTLGDFGREVMEVIGTAVGVAIIEEILFRGAIFGAFRKAFDWRIALVVSSMIFAIVHFMQSADLPGPVNWSSGLRLLPLMLRGFGNLDSLIPAFLSLTLIGVVLGLAYQRTGNLYFSIGLHAGWIFWLRAYGRLTMPTAGGGTHRFLGTQKLTDGWLTICLLILVLMVLAALPLGKSKDASS